MYIPEEVLVRLNDVSERFSSWLFIHQEPADPWSTDEIRVLHARFDDWSDAYVWLKYQDIETKGTRFTCGFMRHGRARTTTESFDSLHMLMSELDDSYAIEGSMLAEMNELIYGGVEELEEKADTGDDDPHSAVCIDPQRGFW